MLCSIPQGVVALLLIGQWVRQMHRANKFGADMGTYRHQVLLAVLVIGCMVTSGGAVWFSRHPSDTPASIQPPPAPSAPIAKSSQPEQTKSQPANQPTSPAVRGNDNTLYGNVGNRAVAGSGNTIVGATDDHGNTIIRGDTTIGHNARSAGPSSVVIGADAGPQQPTYKQECNGSACAQGPGSQATYNQFGANKLQMAGNESTAICSAMKPFAGTRVELEINISEQDSDQFGSDMQQALECAGISVNSDRAPMLVVYGARGSGVTAEYSDNHQAMAEALQKAMQNEPLYLSPFPLENHSDTFVVVVQPNR